MVRYGIVGFGLHGVKRLMPGFAGASNSTVVALSRRNLAQGREDAKRFNVPHVFASTEELCQSVDVDVVFVSSPNAFHLSDTLTSLKHGKAVLCEKPMAMNSAEAEQMKQAAEKAGLLLGIAQCFRFEDSVRRIREKVRAGETGKVISIRIDFTFAGLNSPRTWLNDVKLAGGGPIGDVGVHCIDSMRFILGSEPQSVMAMTSADENAGSVESSALLSLRFSNGVLGSSYVSYRAPYQTPIEIYGTEGTIRAHDGLTVDHPITIETRSGSEIAREEITNYDTYSRQVDAFSAAFENKEAFPISAEEGLQNQRILDACYRSAASGREEQVV
jgi:1,5-anhydro-D-fructose reductase (1,5-anhydro-D-mannitol-forming)